MVKYNLQYFDGLKIIFRTEHITIYLFVSFASLKIISISDVSVGVCVCLSFFAKNKQKRKSFHQIILLL